ncbi:Rap ran-GTPase-activating [Lecanosticta acicola]|uniref:Rap ran-GTPase-activating n=1 Tax=Lecanosticta acicola TaxID=111012 RepID=A0AAI8YS07_9PEZI|nr:Rap ran-GTPase-activating [Lecanosticta acicola]
MDAGKVHHRDIAPYETFACERLTREIALCEYDPSKTSSSSPILPPHPPLAEVLREAGRTIQFHAKWFAPAALSTLLQTALDVTSRSSSTADLLAALSLIDTIVTYSLLPVLLPPIRFLAYSYYQGTRSLRHKKLSHRAWTVASHILQSHLGGQFAAILLVIVRDPHTQLSKFKLSAATGALMVITEKLLPDRHANPPLVNPTQLLFGLRHAGVGENVILREQLVALLSGLLQNDGLTQQIDAVGAWDIWLDVFGDCIQHGTDVDRDILESAFENLSTKIPALEARHHPRMAQWFVEARMPLPASLSSQLVVPWQRALLLEEDTMWTAEYRTVLGKLCDSTFYLAELDAFITTSVSAFFQTEDYVSRKDFVYTLETLILDPGTAAPAVDVLAKGMVKIFTHKTQKHKWEGQRNWLFPILCAIAKHSLEATRLLLRIRADEADQGYLALERDTAHTSSSDTAALPSYSTLYGLTSLSFESWVSALQDLIAHEPQRWDVYHELLRSLAPQIRNHALWRGRYEYINRIRRALCECLSGDSFVEPPAQSGETKSSVIAYLLQILSATISYHSHLPRNDIKAAVITIINVAGSRDHTVSIHCIHALTICCYELPELMAGYMDAIINKMTRMVTQRYLALYVLEFFAGLSRFPDLQDRLRREDFKRIFGVCHSYLQSIRSTTALERKRTPTSEHSAGLSSSTSSDEMAQYVYTLAHHIITFWYMALKRDDRHGLKDYITSCLRYKDLDDREHIEEQGMVTIDLMDRVDAEEQINAPLEQYFDEKDGRIITRHRVTGILLITTETSLRTGKTIVTIRRPSGTAQRTITSKKRHDSAMTAELETRFTASVTVESDEQDYISVFPDDISGRTYGKVAIPRPSSALGSLEIIELPENPAVTRAIQQFDRTSALDSHKAGIIYIGEEQTAEKDILLNVSGSPDYKDFLEDMGSLRKLKGATFNTQGLDRQDDLDGAYTIVWNNDVTELVYHITTFMPNNPADEHSSIVNKKRHIGNDYVNIVFNNSGLDFQFDTFPSAFNYVYVVISPSERTTFLQAREITAAKAKKDRFYNVHCKTRPGYPNLSSASEVKVISGASLGGYVRNLTLNACVFSAMWQAGGEAGEYPSSWRTRLQMIRRLYGQYRTNNALEAN